jgi:hypothetical protein
MLRLSTKPLPEQLLALVLRGQDTPSERRGTYHTGIVILGMNSKEEEHW